MTYTKDYPMKENITKKIYFTMFTHLFTGLSEKYRIYVFFAHEYTKCFTGKRGLWEE
jgi:hypothetical protein